MKRQICIFLLLTLLLPISSLNAQDYRENGKEHYRPEIRPVLFGVAACRKELFHFCRGILPGRGRVIQCLVDNLEDLSPSCADYVSQYADKKESLSACNQDAKTFCPDIPPGGGRVLQCLIEKKEEISPLCRSALNAAEKELDGW